MTESSGRERDAVELRQATERLLAWGFPARCIAEQLHCSASYVYRVRRTRAARYDDLDDPSPPAGAPAEKMDPGTR